jgi:Transcriptional regulator
MSRPRKTENEIAEMRERIVDTAEAILEEEGIEALSARRIAERMGVAHMSLFTYFDNQASILEALRKRIVLSWRQQQEEFLERGQSEPIVPLVQAFLKTYVQFAVDRPNLFRLAWVMPEKIGGNLDENRLNLRRNVEILAQLLNLGMQDGSFEPRDPFLAASTVLCMVNIPHILYHTGKLVDPALRDAMIAELFSAAMLYLQKK